MREYYNADELRTQLATLPHLARVAFGLLLFERALPGYYKYLTESGFRDRNRLREVGAEIWRGLEIGEDSFVIPDSDWDEIIETEGSVSFYTTSALDAVNIAYEIVSYLGDKDIGHILNCVSLRIDTVDVYIQNKTPLNGGDENIDSLVFEHKLMQQELESQHADLQALANAGSLSAGYWFVALNQQVNGGYSCLRLAD